MNLITIREFCHPEMYFRRMILLDVDLLVLIIAQEKHDYTLGKPNSILYTEDVRNSCHVSYYIII